MKPTIIIPKTLDYIDNHLAESLGLDELARRVCMSKYAFHRLFRQTVGEPVYQYVRRRRMERAADRLIRTDQPIMEIALNSRYASQEAFSRAFRQVYALSPGKYRRLFADKNRTIIHLVAYTHRSAQMAA